jgi:hypothetical protein
MYAVRITPEGKSVLEKAQPIAKNVDAAVLEALSDTERETFAQLLRKVVSQSGVLDEQVAAQSVEDYADLIFG